MTHIACTQQAEVELVNMIKCVDMYLVTSNDGKVNRIHECDDTVVKRFVAQLFPDVLITVGRRAGATKDGLLSAVKENNV